MQSILYSDLNYDQQNKLSYEYIMQPNQYKNNYTFGEVGISTAGGSAGNYVRADLVDISSELSGRNKKLGGGLRGEFVKEEISSPVPKRIEPEQNIDTKKLLPIYTREKKSAIDNSTGYNVWHYLPEDPQKLDHIIENMWAQRGGLDTQSYTKDLWESRNNNRNLCGFSDSLELNKSFRSSQPNYPFQGPYIDDIKSVGFKKEYSGNVSGDDTLNGMYASV